MLLNFGHRYVPENCAFGCDAVLRGSAREYDCRFSHLPRHHLRDNTVCDQPSTDPGGLQVNRNWIFTLSISVALLAGCATPQQGSIPVVDAGGPLSSEGTSSTIPNGQSLEQDSGVVVMVPSASSSVPLQTYPAPGSAGAPVLPSSEPLPVGGYAMPVTPVSSSPTGIPAGEA